jgi:excisionase family DNA binding protein
MTERFLTSDELCDELHISRRSLRRLISDGTLEAGVQYVRIGRVLRFSRLDVLAVFRREATKRASRPAAVVSALEELAES